VPAKSNMPHTALRVSEMEPKTGFITRTLIEPFAVEVYRMPAQNTCQDVLNCGCLKNNTTSRKSRHDKFGPINSAFLPITVTY
jgi:hypothetical protein